MYSLAIETSGRVGSVALVRDGVVLAEPTFEHGLKHAAGILPMIDSLCREHGVRPGDLAELYLSIGPGSFTGLRIGVTMAKTMSLTTGVKIVAVPTVDVLAANAPTDARHVIIVLDAKRDQIFTAAFDSRDASLSPAAAQRMKELRRRMRELGVEIRAEGVNVLPDFGSDNAFLVSPIERESAHLDSLTNMLARSPRPVHLIGEGIPYHEKFIPKEDGVIVTPPELWRARAGVVATLGMKMAREGNFADPDRLVPLYIRKSEAEEKWDEKQKAEGRGQKAE